jgi:hypothetical protein
MMRVMLGGKSRHREQKRKALGQMYPTTKRITDLFS